MIFKPSLNWLSTTALADYPELLDQLKLRRLIHIYLYLKLNSFLSKEKKVNRSKKIIQKLVKEIKSNNYEKADNIFLYKIYCSYIAPIIHLPIILIDFVHEYLDYCFKEYLIIDQQIARHFVQYSECL